MVAEWECISILFTVYLWKAETQIFYRSVLTGLSFGLFSPLETSNPEFIRKEKHNWVSLTYIQVVVDILHNCNGSLWLYVVNSHKTGLAKLLYNAVTWLWDTVNGCKCGHVTKLLKVSHAAWFWIQVKRSLFSGQL